MRYIQVDENNRMYEFDPNLNYSNSDVEEEKIFNGFLKQYQWEKFKEHDYNRGKHHIFVIFNYEREIPLWVGFLHALECNNISKKSIQELNLIKNSDIFKGNVVFIHTISVEFFFRRKGYASFMVNVVKERFLHKATLMVEATKKGKKFWPAVGFVIVQRTLKGKFMLCNEKNVSDVNGIKEKKKIIF